MLKPEKTPLLRPPGGPVAVNGSPQGKLDGLADGLAEAGGAARLPQGRTMLAGVAYCGASVSMVLTNKIAMSAFGSPKGLMLLQCSLCLGLVSLCFSCGVAKRQPLNLAIVRRWMPVNLVFISMLWTSFVAFKYLTVPTITVLKNMANLFTIVGDYVFFGRTYSPGIWAVLALTALSAVASGLTDLEFSAIGYFWQMVNCMFTAAYSLYLRRVMDDVKQVTEDGQPLNEMSMVLLNNGLSVPLLFLTLVCSGELGSFLNEPQLRNPAFLVPAFMSGLVSFGISFASLWFLSTTTPTTYSLVGSLNKLPIALLSLYLFKDRNSSNPRNLASVAIGLAAGVVFVWTKAVEAARGTKGPAVKRTGWEQA